jgi:hypothetical protein
MGSYKPSPVPGRKLILSLGAALAAIMVGAVASGLA